MNNCAVSFINYKLILNLLLLAGHPFIGLALTINAKNPSNIWLLAYTLYIIYFTSSIGIPILGLLGVIFPAMMMKNNDEYGPYRMQAVVLTAIILIYFNNFSKVF